MEPSSTELGGHFAANQMVDPDPGQRAKRYFERTGPVGSAMKRIACDPAVDLRANLVQVSAVARQQIGLRQNNQMLMAIQFPDRFVVARARAIEVRNAAEVREPGFNAAHIVAPPANIGAGVDGAAKNWKLAALYLSGQIDNLPRRLDEGHIRQWQAGRKAGIERGGGRERGENQVE